MSVAQNYKSEKNNQLTFEVLNTVLIWEDQSSSKMHFIVSAIPSYALVDQFDAR
jgi:hypothetical protein